MSGRTYRFTGGYTEPIRLGTGEIVQSRCRGIATCAFDPEAGAPDSGRALRHDARLLTS